MWEVLMARVCSFGSGLLGFLSIQISLVLYFSFKLPLPAEAAQLKYCRQTEMRPLPGGLDATPCFNSNSPELVLKEGILLSTFPPQGMKHERAHLNFSFDGRFDLFSHHVARNESPEEERTLFIGFILGNPGNKRVRVQILCGASYLSQPDAPFISLPEICSDNEGKVFSGPGDRVCNDVLRGKPASFLPKSIILEPGQDKLLFSLPVPVRRLKPALNGRSTFVKLKSSAPVYVASLARFAGTDTGITEKEWLDALYSGNLAGPRDEAPTSLGYKGRIKYGRAAGVSLGTEWNAVLCDPASESQLEKTALSPEIKLEPEPDSGDLPAKSCLPGPQNCLPIASPGKSISFPLSTVEGGTFGTAQIQSAPMLVRYPDTAYLNNGNYAVTYKIKAVLYNPFLEKADLQVLFQTAIKSEEGKEICFYDNPHPRAFFRGTVRCIDGSQVGYWHLVQKQGLEGAKLAEFSIPAGGKRSISLDFLYPPDATPPQVLTIRTLEKKSPVQ